MEAVAAKDEAAEQRLREANRAIEDKLAERARALAEVRKEVEDRRVAQANAERERIQAEGVEAERARLASARRAAAMKEKQQMDMIIENRKKNARAQDRIASIEAAKSEREEKWRQQRRRNSILGHQRVAEQRKRAMSEAKSRADAKECKTEAAQRKADLEREDILRRMEQARKIAEKEMRRKSVSNLWAKGQVSECQPEKRLQVAPQRTLQQRGYRPFIAAAVQDVNLLQ